MNDYGKVINDTGRVDDGRLNDRDGYQGEAVINVLNESERDIWGALKRVIMVDYAWNEHCFEVASL